MRSKTLVRILALLAVAALAIPALAKPISKNISILQPAKVGSTQLSVGEYRILVDGSRVTIQKFNKTVAEVEGRWEQRDKKAERNSIVLGPNDEVQEIRFQGESRVLILATP